MRSTGRSASPWSCTMPPPRNRSRGVSFSLDGKGVLLLPHCCISFSTDAGAAGESRGRVPHEMGSPPLLQHPPRAGGAAPWTQTSVPPSLGPCRGCPSLPSAPSDLSTDPAPSPPSTSQTGATHCFILPILALGEGPCCQGPRERGGLFLSGFAVHSVGFIKAFWSL